MARMRRCFLRRPILICTDGLKTYIRGTLEVFRDPVVTGHSGGTKLCPWRHLMIAQVIKRTERRRRSLAQQTCTLRHGMYVVGSVYSWRSPHLSLDSREPTTPAMAAGITAHCWNLHELLSFKVPLPQWKPPKRRGRLSQALQGLISRWCGNHV